MAVIGVSFSIFLRTLAFNYCTFESANTFLCVISTKRRFLSSLWWFSPFLFCYWNKHPVVFYMVQMLWQLNVMGWSFRFSCRVLAACRNAKQNCWNLSSCTQVEVCTVAGPALLDVATEVAVLRLASGRGNGRTWHSCVWVAGVQGVLGSLRHVHYLLFRPSWLQ
jgi:hypothetical protein